MNPNGDAASIARTTRPASLFEFLRALTVSWKTIMSGAISVLLTFLAIFLPADQYKRALFAAAALSILWACYQVWANERNRTTTLADFLTRPHLLVSIHKCYSCSLAHSPTLLLRLDVVNKSPAQVTVKGVKLEIIENGIARLFRYREDATSDKAKFNVNLLHTKTFVIQERQLSDLLNQIAAQPLELGIHRSGDLIFIFDDATKFSNPIRLRLTLIDAFGEEHRAEKVIECIEGVWFG